MPRTPWLAAASLFALTLGTAAQAQTPPGDAQTVPDTSAQTREGAAPADDGADVVVTARQREESLKDVPISVTAISGDRLKDLQVNTVRDIANYAPGVNINSDSVGRAFVSIRGIGTTLIDTVQPGVGIFIDGVYQPNTSYLNSPIVDVARVEVLRGPQGTLFGNNTLGGAINVITRLPGNEFEGRVDAAYAGDDDYQSLSGTISGPIVRDLLQFRIGAAYHKQDGFMRNTLANGDANPVDQRSVSGTLRFLPAPWAVFTLNANYDRVYGGSTAYIQVAGPTDYRLDGRTNQLNRTGIDYYGTSLKSEFTSDELKTKATVVLAYNQRDVTGTSDGDFGPVDLLRSNGNSRLTTKTAEIRLDTQWSDAISTLVGVFGDRYIQRGVTLNTLNFAALGVPLPPSTTRASAYVRNDNRAVFGTLFAKLSPALDLAVGGRFDHQRLRASQVNGVVPFNAPDYERSQFQPRVTLTDHVTETTNIYASVAKGIRGGGQNGPGTRPEDLIYDGDSVWTYELGAKFASADNRVSINAALFYNDYDNFIGQNSLAPNATGNGFVAINLNTGHVESYGGEIEAHVRLTDAWRIDGGVSYLHARITDDSQYFATTGTRVSSDRVIFTPDYNFNLTTNYTVPLGENGLVFDAGVYGKGSRVGSSLDPAVTPRLSPYAIVNASVGFKLANGLQLTAFGTNLFNAKYIESYIDKSALVRAGLAALATNLAIQGDRRRYGVRATYRF